MNESVSFGDVIAVLLAGPADGKTVRAAFDAILAGAWTPVQIGAFAVALRLRGESEEVLVAGASALRGAMVAVEHRFDTVVDTCGTGGDGAHTLNISTAAALVVAGAGFVVAKHGSRSVSSRCGSADVLEALGVPIDVPPERQHVVLEEAKIAFLFAPSHHPALRHAAQARRELGVRTGFNALGPLANPARATHQIVGVYDDALRPILARALARLGVRRAWVVRGEDGLDEVSPSAPTRVSVLDHGEVHELVIVPEDFGLKTLDRSAIHGSDAAHNATAIVAILEGRGHPARDAVLLNAAAALAVVTGDDARSCAERARVSLASGAANAALERFRKAAIEAKGP